MRLVTAPFLAFMLSIAAAPTHACSSTRPSRSASWLAILQATGSVDATARIVAERLGLALQQPVVVTGIARARPGISAADLLAKKAAPDGYTLYVGTTINAVSVGLFKEACPTIRSRTSRRISKVVVAPFNPGR